MNCKEARSWLSSQGGTWRRDNLQRGYRVIVIVGDLTHAVEAIREGEFSVALARAASELRSMLDDDGIARAP